MKKVIVTILSILYLASTTGASLHMHFCMGKLADWNIGQNKSETCSKCGMDKSDEKLNGCCKDEHKFFKNVTDQKISETGFQLIKLFAAVLPVTFFEITLACILSATEENPVSHAPPRSSGVAVYIRNCIFLI